MSFSGQKFHTIENAVISAINLDTDITLNQNAARSIKQLFCDSEDLIDQYPYVYVECTQIDIPSEDKNSTGNVTSLFEDFIIKLQVGDDDPTNISDLIYKLDGLLSGNSLGLTNAQGARFAGAKRIIKGVDRRTDTMIYEWELEFRLKLLRC